ncbi:MAG: succinate dehydrogenase/fumarate reductase cytochrome b subunit, partial [Dysgonamonadaceae bacterium]|nr:succinate dehydrogenase/fumarate reductase cytochrome b subunit [Dysgonamonadaceae bacterium]
LGLIVLLGLAVHLWNFWYEMQFKELFHIEGAVSQGSGLVSGLFANPIYAVIYLAWLTAIWFHLTHGIWSAFQTLGLNNKIWYPRMKFIGNAVATFIMLLFAVCPVYFAILSFLK